MPPAHQPDNKDWSERRADARRNHEKVTVAALAVFAGRGMEATVSEIAVLAGVGKATVYRSYPTRADLVDAIARRHLTWLTERIEQASTVDDAINALQNLLRDLSDKLATDRSFAETLHRILQPSDRDHTTDLLTKIITTAQRQGRLRPDTTAQDIRVLVGGYAHTLRDLGIRDPGQWRRYADLVLDALRT
ncbi:TetR/AcrR family transcriptional regulator [Nocardia noduli]|uniref:TetR/AcrR family transcriptional regulator n=1 Tax=Nocardia noduli TaxID=2815722 RepID=UPI001C21CBF6|nr:TetR/AcrR family transcriptional regulator [Nocardia noduli]